MRMESQVERNKLRQYSNDFLMYGKYNVEMLQNVIDTVNVMHRRQTELEKTGLRQSLWRHRNSGRKHAIWLLSTDVHEGV